MGPTGKVCTVVRRAAIYMNIYKEKSSLTQNLSDSLAHHGLACRTLGSRKLKFAQTLRQDEEGFLTFSGDQLSEAVSASPIYGRGDL